MDSSQHLDYALFQLTPTRTRCDLVVFSGGKNEKLASGLLEPFISHLRYAKEQIPKGGYSITLRPPTTDSSWFTKGTLERFVRFVSTPEVLERFVTIEQEISQIESSVQSNELSNTSVAEQTEEEADNNGKKSIVPFKPKGECKGINEDVQEENSKHRLQRVLETRKAVLRKEQAMAYARAFVAGYEMDYIDDLIAFADAFGASRLRDACINFKELCYKKHNDGLWMDELAAMEACVQPELPYLGTSGIILTTENSNPSQSILQNFRSGGLSNEQHDPNGSLDASVTESTASHASSDVNQGQIPSTAAQAQFPMHWPNQLPQYMYNFQSPVMQQMPPYQGFPYPGMQVPPQYQGNMQWPPNREEYGDGLRESNHRRNRKLTSKKKEKSPSGKEFQTSEQDGHTEPSESTSEDDLHEYLQHDQDHSSTEKLHKRRNGKKSSRMVVIRNINYITSKRKDGEKDDASDESSLDEEEFIDGNALKQRVEDAVGSLEKHHKLTTRHHKKRGGNKNANQSNDVVNQDLENDSVAISEGVKTNENWGAFQNLLLRDDGSDPHENETQSTLDVRDEYFAIKSSESGPLFAASHAVDLESEKGTAQRMTSSDSFIVTERDTGNEGSTHMENFEKNENFHLNMKRMDYTDEELLFSQRNDDARRNVQDTLSQCNTELSTIKTQRGEDWFVIEQPEKSVGTDAMKDSSIFEADNSLTLRDEYVYTEKNKKDVLVDDSFMIQSRSLPDDEPNSQWRTDLSMVSGLTVASEHESGIPDPSGDKCGMSGAYEPDDLYMVLDRDSRVEPTASSWATEVDYGMDISFTEADKNDGLDDKSANDAITENKSNLDPETKHSGKESRSKPLRGSLGKSKTEIISRNKKPSAPSRLTVNKSKFETEEETRKRMEELLIERQKRIAERSAARGFSAATSKKIPIESKKATTSVKDDKRTSRSSTQDPKRLSLQKPGITSSTVDRLTSGQVKNKESSNVPLKSVQPKKISPKVNSVVATMSPKTARVENKKSKLNQDRSSKQLDSALSPLSDVKEKDQSDGSASKMKVELRAAQEVRHLDGADTSVDKELCAPPSTITKIEQKSIVDVDTLNDKSFDESPIGIRKSSLPVDQHSANIDSLKLENGRVSITSPILHDEKEVGHALEINGVITETTARPQNAPKASVTIFDEVVDTGNERHLVSNEISESEITPDQAESTPPSTSELSLDSSYSRRKWTTDESSPPTAKGFKKLLMFGRKKPLLAS